MFRLINIHAFLQNCLIIQQKSDAEIEYFLEKYSLMASKSHSNKSAVSFESNPYKVDSGGGIPLPSIHYHPRMWAGNVFGHVCLSVCLSVRPSVQAITFELLHTKTSFLVGQV